MKTKLQLVFILSVIGCHLLAQNKFREVNFPGLYDRKGIVFNEHYEIPLELPTKTCQFSPTNDEIEKAELYLLKNIDSLNLNGKIKKSRLKHCKRQYFGYKVDKDKYIVIQLLYFKKERKGNEKFVNWEREYFIGLGEYYYKRVRRIKVNLNRERIEIF
jgi:hypothetical protein